MTRRLKPPILVLLLVFAACGSPRRTYYYVEKEVGQKIDYLVDARKEGRIDKTEVIRLTPIINGINDTMKRWHKVLLETPKGEKPDLSSAIYDAAIDWLARLSVWYQQYKAVE